MTAEAREYVVSLSEVSDCLRKAQPGDRIVIRQGTYTDNMLKWQGSGTAQQPVTIEAQQPGMVVLSGETSVQVACEYLIIRGLYFKGAVPTRRGVIDFAIGNRYAYNCRLTDCVMDDCNTPRRDVVCCSHP
jgi:poly(beta-D-mannuronate) lyase